MFLIVNHITMNIIRACVLLLLWAIHVDSHMNLRGGPYGKGKGPYDKEASKQINTDISSSYSHIHQSIIEAVKDGKHRYSFAIKCAQTSACSAKKTGHDIWIESHLDDVVNRHDVPLEMYTAEIMSMVRHAFPDSNITNTYKNCCTVHTVRWNEIDV